MHSSNGRRAGHYLPVLAGILLLSLPSCETGPSGSAGMVQSLQMPAGVRVIEPGQDIPAPLAAFSGVWGGRWRGVSYGQDWSVDSLVIVERVSANGDAQGTYVLGDAPPYLRAGSWKFAGKIADGKLTWAWGTNRFVYSMDNGILSGRRYVSDVQDSSQITMRKVTVAQAARTALDGALAKPLPGFHPPVVGSVFTYRTSSGSVYSRTIVRVDSSVVTERSANGSERDLFGGYQYLSDRSGAPLTFAGDDLSALWPLMVGKTAKYRVLRWGTQLSEVTLKVVGQERVEVPAGSFDTVLLEAIATDRGGSNTYRYWLVPEIGRWVKLEEEDRTGSTLNRRQETVLSAMRLNRAPSFLAAISVTAPDPSVPSAMATFAGKWAGVTDAARQRVMVIDKLTASGSAEVIHAWDDSSRPEGFKPNRYSGRIENGVLSFSGGGDRYEFKTEPNGDLSGIVIRDGAQQAWGTITMSRVPTSTDVGGLDQAHWLLGVWKGEIADYRPPEGPVRVLTVTHVSPDGSVTGAWALAEASNFANTRVTVRGDIVTVITSASSRVELTRSDTDLAGTFTLANGRSYSVRLSRVPR